MAPSTSRRRPRGGITWLPSGAARVSVYGGVDQLTGKEIRRRQTGPQLRRVPDDTAATVERAQLAMAEIDARRAAEAAEQARTVDTPPEHEDRRRDELISWAGDDLAGEASSAQDTDGDEDVLDR